MPYIIASLLTGRKHRGNKDIPANMTVLGQYWANTGRPV